MAALKKSLGQTVPEPPAPKKPAPANKAPASKLARTSGGQRRLSQAGVIALGLIPPKQPDLDPFLFQADDAEDLVIADQMSDLVRPEAAPRALEQAVDLWISHGSPPKPSVWMPPPAQVGEGR